ncbi:hypothetical protein L6Q96_11050 [Candidatus Binatia bacterium]|nr:hypothetical protein [Candidatus Binatia bacterium]
MIERPGLKSAAFAVALFVALLWIVSPVSAGPPAQGLPSAFLVFPLIESTGYRDTRIEIVNLSGNPQELECFFVEGSACMEIGFVLILTPYQPLTWLASSGLVDLTSGSAAPPFWGEGELKCVVVPPRPEAPYHNTIQGRATAFGLDGRTLSYGAVAFQRLSDGDYTGTINLNGSAYAQCPRRLHFDVLTETSLAASEVVVVPCTEDLLLQKPTTLTVQVLVVNEFEQTYSASYGFTCFDRRVLSQVADPLLRSIAATDTAHLILRGVGGPLLGLVVDAVPYDGFVGMAGNEPSFEGGSSATVVFPERP